MNLVIILLRFSGNIPTLLLAARSTWVYHTLRGFPDLIQNAPGGTNLRASLRLLAVATWIIVGYNSVSFLAAFMVPLEASFVFLPFDLSFCAILLTALVLQTSSMPKLPTDCKHSSDTLANGYFKGLAEAKLSVWKPRKDSDGNVLAPPSPSSQCSAFYKLWALEITVLILFSIAVVVEIHGSNRYSPLNYGLFHTPWAIISWPFQWAGSAIHGLNASIRFAKNYASKDRRRRARIYTRHLRQDHTNIYLGHRDEDNSASASEAGGKPANVELPAYHAKNGGVVCRSCSQQKAKSDLRRLLCPDETMAAIAKYLHASDIRHLGQASRGIEISLYTHIGPYARSEATKVGSLDFVPLQKKSLLRVGEFLTHADRTELLSRGSCKYGKSDRCWSCDIQICSLCNYHTHASVADIQHHINNCTLYCHKCYFREICLKQRRPLRHARLCSHSTKLGGPREMRSLCKPCSEIPDKDIGIRRERREKRELALLAAQAVRCGNCASGLPSGGIRWWVCTSCNLECTDACHHQE